MQKYFLTLLVSLIAFISYANIAFDSANDSAYEDGWQESDNGGYGFGSWIMNDWAQVQENYFSIGSSTNNGGWFSTNNIDTVNKSFQLMNLTQTNAYIEIFRYLDSSLQAGQRFSFDMDINWRAGYSGIRLRDVGEVPIFRLEVGDFGEGDATYVSTYFSTNQSDIQIHSEYSDDTQYMVNLDQLTPTSGTWSVTRTGGVTDIDSGAYTGKVDSIQLYSSQTLSNINNNIYFNNFAASFIPEFDHYNTWLNSYSVNNNDTSLSADPDNDGMNNQLEFAYGGNPSSSDSELYLPQSSTTSNSFIYIYKKLDTAYAEAYGITYNLEVTENIEFPNWSTNNIITQTSDRFGNYVNVTNTIPVNTDTKFLKHTVISE